MWKRFEDASIFIPTLRLQQCLPTPSQFPPQEHFAPHQLSSQMIRQLACSPTWHAPRSSLQSTENCCFLPLKPIGHSPRSRSLLFYITSKRFSNISNLRENSLYFWWFLPFSRITLDSSFLVTLFVATDFPEAQRDP